MGDDKGREETKRSVQYNSVRYRDWCVRVCVRRRSLLAFAPFSNHVLEANEEEGGGRKSAGPDGREDTGLMGRPPWTPPVT